MSLGSYLGVRAPPAVWDEFVEAFQGHFLPPEMKRARVDRFLHLKQNGSSVREYRLEFDSLARHALLLWLIWQTGTSLCDGIGWLSD